MFERMWTGAVRNGVGDRRKFVAVAAMALLAACKVVPSGPPVTVPVPDRPISNLPTDTERHRIALIVPMSGANASVGQSIANAATSPMALQNPALGSMARSSLSGPRAHDGVDRRRRSHGSVPTKLSSIT